MEFFLWGLAYSKARQYCQKALEVNPNYGNAYLLIGKMYAATSKSVFPNDGVLAISFVERFMRSKQQIRKSPAVISAYCWRKRSMKFWWALLK